MRYPLIPLPFAHFPGGEAGMEKYKVRSVTLHYPQSTATRTLEDLEVIAAKLHEAIDRASSNVGIQVESARIVIQTGDPRRLDVEPENLAEMAGSSSILLSLGALRGELLGDEDVRSLLKEFARYGIFYSILLPQPEWKEARIISEFIHSLAEEDPSIPTRMGVNTLGEPLITPYYPLASAPLNGSPKATVSLTYPNYLLEAFRSNGWEGMVNAMVEAGKTALALLDETASILGVEALGVDLSIAPWMEESSLGLVEYIAGVRMPEPGFVADVYSVNAAIGEAARRLGRTVGFNELQLPVAEDLKLKARVSELETTARDLARFSCACLAGLDLAVVPSSIEGVAGLILDVSACARTKGKSLGVRIVPVEDVEPGDKVWLEKFGETPVIPL
jgi:uncharacterized protein (UPF0210 family)